MIDSEARKDLSQRIRQLVTGRITNDAFDDLVYAPYMAHSDAAVREIATFGSSLYGDLYRYRLKGEHAVDSQTRAAAARCVLFLRSDLEYCWPEPPKYDLLFGIAWAAIYLAIPLAIALFVISLFAALSRDFTSFAIIAACGFSPLAVRWLLMKVSARHFDSLWDSFRAHGDYDVWPFIREEDFEHAQRTLHLLGSVTVED